MNRIAYIVILLSALLLSGCTTTTKQNAVARTPREVIPQLMFEGDAEEAMNLYVSIFDDAEIVDIMRYPPVDSEPQGKIMRALFRIHDQLIACTDSPVSHGFTFTPSISFFVECDSEAEIRRLHEELSRGGMVLMPLQAYPFSPMFTWVQDRFGVSWQLNHGDITPMTDD